MKSIIQIALVALIVGGVSAGGSYYWHLSKPKPAAPAETAKAETDKKSEEDNNESAEKSTDVEVTDAADPKNSDTASADQVEVKADKSEPKIEKTEPFSFGPPVSVRPPFSADGDEAGDLIHKLRVRLASTSRQERRVAEREEAMKLIVDDLRMEQAKAAKIRKRLLDEQTKSLQSIDEARRAVDAERGVIYDDLEETRRIAEEKIQTVEREKEQAVRAAEEAMRLARNQQEELQKELDEMRKPAVVRDRSGSPEATANIKKTAGALDSMPPENTAKILQETVKEGRTEAVVALLNAMKPRVSAKVISAITETDPILAADLIERLKRMKTEANSPAATAK